MNFLLQPITKYLKHYQFEKNKTEQEDFSI